MISDPDSESSSSPAARFRCRRCRPPPSPPVPIFAKDVKDPPCPGPRMGMFPCVTDAAATGAAVVVGFSGGVLAGNCSRSETKVVQIRMTTATAGDCHCQCLMTTSPWARSSHHPRWDPPTTPLPLHLLQPSPPLPAQSPNLAPTSSSPFQLSHRIHDEAPRSAHATSA
ncbi:hypothetical protein F5888DRAFT_1685103, partial [Russula emetica]